jgi:phosphatidylserine decarboxylase
MAITLKEWLDTEIKEVKDKSIKWLSEFYFHRCELRPVYIDHSRFFSPADGVIMDVHQSIAADKPFIEAKGTTLTLQELMKDETLKGDFLVVSIFMTFYNDHHNYIPYSGGRKYRELPSLNTYNRPMLAVEKDLLNEVINPEFQEEYLRANAREVSEIFAPRLGQNYYVVRIGDYDVDVFLNYLQKNGAERTSYLQNNFIGKIICGSQCILAIPHGSNKGKFQLRSEATKGNVVKAGLDALVDVFF